jgi:hypothetical protein
LIGLGCSVLGGYVAAWIAKHDELVNGAASAWLCLLISAFTTVPGLGSHSFAYRLLLLAASPISGLLGGSLRLAQNRLAVRPA